MLAYSLSSNYVGTKLEDFLVSIHNRGKIKKLCHTDWRLGNLIF